MHEPVTLTPLFLAEEEFMPESIEPGILYISEFHGITIHLCACGCKSKTVMDLQPRWKDGWILTRNGDKVTFRPSIGNFSGENPYHAHYVITDNIAEFC